MNATELHLAGGKSAGIFFCGKCRHVAASQVLAEQCCQNYKCQVCGQDTGGRSWLVCDKCRATKDTQEEAERFSKAEKLTEWAGWVFDGSEFFESVQDLCEIYESDDDELPEYVWACKENHFVKADVSDITERLADNAYDDWDPETLNGLDELKAALDKFNAANANACSYTPDYTKAVLLKGQTA